MRFAYLAAVTACICGLVGPAAAQQAPNAGAILRQLEPEAPTLPAPTEDASHQPAAAAVPAGPILHVTAFRIQGNQRIATARIEKLLAGFLNRDLSPADLRQATDSVARFYAKRGWLARVFVPAQRMENGTLVVQVVEGRLGRVSFAPNTDVKTLHVSAQRILDRVQVRLTPGEPLSQSDLTRGVLIAGDLPGIGVSANEVSGGDNGLTDVLLTVKNQNLLSGEFSIDNYGQASIGSERAAGWLDFNSLFGFGEEFGVLGVLTPDLKFGRFSGRLPLTDDGLNLGFTAAGLNYEVHAPRWNAFHARGSSDSFGADLEYQLIRAVSHNVSIGVTALRKNFYNDNLFGRVADYSIYDALLYANANLYDSLWGGAVSTATLSLGHGWVSMAGSPGELDDRFGPDTQGQFGLLRYRVDRMQTLKRDLFAYIAVSGQLSYQNLDPSEQFYLSGPVGVRAYPVSSNGGSTGQLLNTELRWVVLHAAHCTCGLKLLYDIGHIRLNANDGFAFAPEPNAYFLQGVGLGAYGNGPAGLAFSVTVVRRVGGDAYAEIPDAGLTGARQDTRVWGSLSWQF